MSFPNVPDITPEIKLDRRDTLNLLLTSIAMEELAISHILNAEAEKLQYVLKMDVCIEEILRVNKSMERVLRSLIKKEMLLQYKLENVMDMEELIHPPCYEEDECPE